ncbi:hypothetical protein SAMN05444351_1902 [Geodermatophilus nigrescens]|uniref:Uncharacterized protein n=1 Tax=Geodermatophilus nigrescens TaxID=1070870 RepID=A0A1M5I6N0_9ACTN|nr:hypothetical protein SAMN05444351_1902 [Geodermatophilus nigrescens]
MAVSVDVKRIKAALRHDYGLWVLVSASTSGALVDALASWVAEAEPRLGQRPDLQGVQLLGPLLLPDGTSLLRLVNYGNSTHLVAVVTDLSATLEAAGLDARIGVPRDIWNPLALAAPRYPDDVAGLTALTAVSVTLPWRADAVGRRQRRRAFGAPNGLRGWVRSDVQDEAWTAVVDTALAWCQELRSGATGARYVAHGVSSLQPDPAQWEATARLALGSEHLPVQASVVDWPGEARDVSFGYQPGRVLFNLQEETFGSPESTVSWARELIERLLPHITSAFVVQAVTRGPALVTEHLLRRSEKTTAPSSQPQERAPASQLHELAPMDDRRIIDAFGVMYLGPGFRGLADDPQLYRVEQLGPGRLLTANNLDAWFRSDPWLWVDKRLPKPLILEAARADLAGTIATYDEYRRAKRSNGQDVPQVLG